MAFNRNISTVRATVIVTVAFSIVACKGKLKTTEKFDITQVPVQVVNDMFIVQTNKGQMQLRAEAPVMERYDSDSLEWQLFPDGFRAYAYDEQGRLETELKADAAKHTSPKFTDESETWAAFGNVTVKNLIKRETMETDTLYWNREKETIYTDCYVKLYSPSGLMQGYGMESDQRGRHSIIHRPFNSYGIMDNDSTLIEIDTVNFIGPMQKKCTESK